MSEGTPRKGYFERLVSTLAWGSGLLTAAVIAANEWMYRTIIDRLGRPPWMDVST